MTKKCTKCKEVKELIEFSKNKKSSDGLQGNCKACNKAYRSKPSVVERIKIYTSKPEYKQYQKDYNKNPEYREKERKRDLEPRRKQTRKQLEQANRKINPAKFRARAAKYRAVKLIRTPKWLTKQHLEEIEEFYILANELKWLSNEILEVDHIIPLRGKNVSGLHVPWNLQILPIVENRSKGNKLTLRGS